jgi:hypothetical protein
VATDGKVGQGGALRLHDAMGKQLEAHRRGGGLTGGQYPWGRGRAVGTRCQLAGEVVGAGAGRDTEVHKGGVKLEEVMVGQSGGWRRLVSGRSSRPRKAVGAGSDGLH